MNSVMNIEKLGKKYVIRHESRAHYVALRDVVAASAKKILQGIRHPLHWSDAGNPRYEEFWALQDVSLNIYQGERVGIIGRNGAGKSTMLKILSRITEPTRGSIRLRGRVASLLEVGTGFHPELTGRENIFLNGAILGMGKTEISRKFEAIVDFAEVEKFLDTPVKHYSSGMYVRLAFSVAAHLESDILIVDEVLAVGDAGFQKKCMGRMESVANEGRTVLFVSHNMGAISELCSRAILLDKGRKVADGNVAEIINQYSQMTATRGQYFADGVKDAGRACVITAIRLLNNTGMETGQFDLNETIAVEFEYRVNEKLKGLQLALTVSRNMIDVLHTFESDQLGPVESAMPGLYRARHVLPGMFLKAGGYTLSLHLGTPDKLIHELSSVVRFDIEETSINTVDKGYRKERPGHVLTPGIWTVEMLEAGRVSV
jgi:lipopolysaccharide transport system ATP-binding protein